MGENGDRQAVVCVVDYRRGRFVETCTDCSTSYVPSQDEVASCLSSLDLPDRTLGIRDTLAEVVLSGCMCCLQNAQRRWVRESRRDSTCVGVFGGGTDSVTVCMFITM